jgi:hypothetical protein
MTTPHNHITFEYYHNLEWEIETRSQNQSFVAENNKTLFYCIMWERQILNVEKWKCIIQMDISK